jgi:hypothetical protein
MESGGCYAASDTRRRGIDNSCLANPIEIVNHLVTKPTHDLASAQRPSFSQRQQLHILFRHPRYDDGNNVLFKLHVSDTDNDGQFATDACAVIAGDCVGRS